MDKLANALLGLDWSDMDTFASEVVEFATDDSGKPNDERYIAQCLVEWARDNHLEQQL
tara:strand:- start:433 stop:606 length:174 start_codon:yes stop_codon:yes gene_type:complete